MQAAMRAGPDRDPSATRKLMAALDGSAASVGTMAEPETESMEPEPVCYNMESSFEDNVVLVHPLAFNSVMSVLTDVNRFDLMDFDEQLKTTCH